MNIRFLLSVILTLFSFLSFSQDKITNYTTIDAEFLEKANAVIRLCETDVNIESKNKMIVSQHRVVTVLNEKGNYYVNAIVGYDKYNKIKQLEALVYDANGNQIKKIKKKDFIDHSAVDGGTLYSDSRVLYMPYTPTSYPYTVDFSFTLDTENTAGIPSWIPIEGYFVSVEKSTYTLKDEAGLGVNKNESNFTGFTVESNNTESSYHYQLNNFKAVSRESYSPIFEKIFPRLSVTVNDFHFYGVDGQATNWVEFGDWMIHKLLKGRDQVSLKTEQEIIDLVEGIEDPIERARLVYNYVQENTRYISVQVGIGGVQPIEAIEVDNVKYGDCKGLTNYTLALMRIANVPAYYSVVEAGKDIIDFDDNFFSLAQGNHIILAIENNDDLLWVDCTSQSHPFGFIGDFTDNRKVLLVKEGDSKIVKTSNYSNQTNLQKINADVIIDEQGGFTSNVKIETEGIRYDNRFYIAEFSDKNINLHYKNFWDKINFLDIEAYDFNNNKDEVIFTENLKVKVNNYGKSISDKLIFRVNVFNANQDVPARYTNRKLPFVIKRGFQDIDDLNITIPNGFEIDFIPEDITIKSDYGEYNASYVVESQKIIYHRSLMVNKGDYSKEDYSKYRDFLKQIVKADKSKIILNKTM
ncbi:DUF3857 domain-containing transglutaminase family protein [Lacinutrix iliipiscaria]|uniref:DUF3857 domain-containing transglutaminase family protein n=1 Tax=Lacinutrix iliipiscaria TaxID=1230532 RepID=A0ABW5WH77_9FLAO